METAQAFTPKDIPLTPRAAGPTCFEVCRELHGNREIARGNKADKQESEQTRRQQDGRDPAPFIAETEQNRLCGEPAPSQERRRDGLRHAVWQRVLLGAQDLGNQCADSRSTAVE